MSRLRVRGVERGELFTRPARFWAKRAPTLVTLDHIDDEAPLWGSAPFVADTAAILGPYEACVGGGYRDELEWVADGLRQFRAASVLRAARVVWLVTHDELDADERRWLRVQVASDRPLHRFGVDALVLWELATGVAQCDDPLTFALTRQLGPLPEGDRWTRRASR